jgi:hypothetical protein
VPLTYRFSLIPGRWAILKHAPDAPIPRWAADATGFAAITRTAEELSLIVPRQVVPADQEPTVEWALIKVHGPFSFAAVGVLASFGTPLANAGISIIAVSTHDTDYVLVRADDEGAARHTLILAGHTYVADLDHSAS